MCLRPDERFAHTIVCLRPPPGGTYINIISLERIEIGVINGISKWSFLLPVRGGRPKAETLEENTHSRTTAG